ncbi:MAG: aKG-HExxH-type peptide beta-hydroxylase [Pseudonocardiaceae bacterium]
MRRCVSTGGSIPPCSPATTRSRPACVCRTSAGSPLPPLLAELDPELHAEFETVVGALRLFRGRAARGITSVRCFGLVFLRLPDPGPEAEESLMYFLDHITHETSHLVLHTLMNVDPLITNGHAQRFDAPIRPDPRPLYGIYHAQPDHPASSPDSLAKIHVRLSVPLVTSNTLVFTRGSTRCENTQP